MIRGPKEKKERSLGIRLQVKGERCLSPKCAMVRKPYKPGMHGQQRKGRRGGLSDFGRQQQEKQKCKIVYGIDERGLRQVFKKSFRKTGSTSLNIIQSLESRLDNVVFRLGFASSRGMARQLAVQGHVLVNGKRVRAPGFLLKSQDTVSFRPESSDKVFVKNLKESLKKYEAPSWLGLDINNLEGRILGLPQDVEPAFEVNLVVESFSK